MATATAPAAATGGERSAQLRGSLADFPVGEVLRLVGDRVGTFRVEGPMVLVLAVAGGEVAVLGGAGRDEVVQVLFHLTLLGDGDFSFEPDADDVHAGAGDRWPLDALLDDVAARVSRWRAISGVLPSLDVVVRLRPQDDDAEVVLAAGTWSVAAALDGTRRVRDVALLVGGDAFATMEAVHGLVTRGLAEVLPTGPPTD